MMKAKLVFLVLLISSLPLYSQQKVNATLEKQEKMIQQLQTENQTLKEDLAKLDKEVGFYRNEIIATRSDLKGDMSNWLTALSIIMGAIGLVLGGALPVLLNVWFDKKQDKKLESIQKKAEEASSQASTAREKAEQAEKALKETQQLKDSIAEIGDKVSASTEKAVNAAKKAEEASSQASTAREKAEQAEKALKETQQLKDSIAEMEKKVSESSEKAKTAASQAMASEWYSEAISEEDPLHALKLINRVIKLSPNLAKAYNRRGIIYSKMKKYKDAEKDFEKAIEICSTNSGYHYNLGRTLALIGLPKHADELLNKAIESFDKSIEINGNYSDAYNARGIVKERLNNHKDAIFDYDKAIELSPEKPLYFRNRARCYDAMANAEADAELKEKYLSKAKEDKEKAESLSKKDEGDSSPNDIEH